MVNQRGTLGTPAPGPRSPQENMGLFGVFNPHTEQTISFALTEFDKQISGATHNIDLIERILNQSAFGPFIGLPDCSSAEEAMQRASRTLQELNSLKHMFLGRNVLVRINFSL